MSKAWIDDLKPVPYERRVHPSALVEEWAWQQAYRDRSPSAAAEWNTGARPSVVRGTTCARGVVAGRS
jgi:hypothetical protein